MSEYTSGEEIHTGVITGNTFPRRRVIYTVINGLAYFEGDIILGKATEMERLSKIPHGPRRSPVLPTAVGVTGVGFRWPGGVVPFTIDPNLPNQARVTNAITHWEQNTFVRFVPRTNEAAFLTFRPGNECSSNVGMIGGQQFITLAAGCDMGSTIHEIGHAVGLWHEQSRENRNSYVQIDFTNIATQNQHNFQQHITDGDDIGPYDFGSIMHYDRFAFAVNSKKPTIISPVPIGQRTGLSAGDIAGVGIIYGRTGLWHTIRHSDGSWTHFGNVEEQAGDRGDLVGAAGACVGGEYHLCGVNSEGRLWHTIRHANGSWLPFGDVEGQTGDVGTFTTVAAAGISDDLHVCGVTTDGRLWHAIRFQGGAWTPFGDVEGQTGDRGFIASVSCAAVGDELHVCGINSRGQFWHAIRRSNGSWTPFGDVEAQTGDRGFFYAPACASVAGELHVCGVNSQGRLWHAMRHLNGSWSGFSDVEGQAGDRGNFIFATCAGIGRELHVSGINSQGRLWHTIRKANGSWYRFGDIEGPAGDRGFFWRGNIVEVNGEMQVTGVSTS